jgi:hypothetical protein
METPTAATDKGKEVTKKYEGLPDSISKRTKAIKLTEGGVVIVEKWSAIKFLTVIDFIVNAVQHVPASTLKSVSTSPNALAIFKVMGERAIGLIELSVRQEDAPKLKDLDAEELVDLLDAVLELNLTEKFLKKVKSLVARFQQFGGTAGLLSTPSK